MPALALAMGSFNSTQASGLFSSGDPRALTTTAAIVLPEILTSASSMARENGWETQAWPTVIALQTGPAIADIALSTITVTMVTPLGTAAAGKGETVFVTLQGGSIWLPTLTMSSGMGAAWSTASSKVNTIGVDSQTAHVFSALGLSASASASLFTGQDAIATSAATSSDEQMPPGTTLQTSVLSGFTLTTVASETTVAVTGTSTTNLGNTEVSSVVDQPSPTCTLPICIAYNTPPEKPQKHSKLPGILIGSIVGLSILGFCFWWALYYRHTERYKAMMARRKLEAIERKRQAKEKLDREREVNLAKYRAEEIAKAEKRERKKAMKLPSIQQVRSGQVELLKVARGN